MTATTDRVPLGPLSVSRQGFGCMGLSHVYGRADEAESLATLERALDLGINFLDTADIYGLGHNEQLVGRAIRGERHKLVIASKFGNRLDAKAHGRALDGRPEYAREAVEASLRRLDVDHIDLYYLHRLDPVTPVEETVGELAKLKGQGKIGAIGLSEVDASVLRRAHAVHPIAALQSEYSLWTREVEAEILPTARELGVGFVAYSPLGRGFLAGAEPVEEKDRRHQHPRFQAEALAANSRRRAVAEGIAARLGVSVAQVSLAWVLSKGVVPIPGTRHVAHLEANWAANDLSLDPATIAELEAAFPVGSTVGARYPAGSPPVPGLQPA
ncbi:aldo/keto reductase [Phenylobacterium sp.]|jgi:aryl-alcohol dehydrogenase-like predicted oxidoreductase|uniref:aldo/keto reductase n=1 Tax=Phenylobacterium sp. TaxID=1871053 RepID=UPI002F417011